MAQLRDTASGVEVRLSKLEQLGALHRGFTIPRGAIASDEVITDPWPELKGWRAPGTGFPWVIMLGTMRYRGNKDFCAIYHRRPALSTLFVASCTCPDSLGRPPGRLPPAPVAAGYHQG